MAFQLLIKIATAEAIRAAVTIKAAASGSIGGLLVFIFSLGKSASFQRYLGTNCVQEPGLSLECSCLVFDKAADLDLSSSNLTIADCEFLKELRVRFDHR
jgi:hypothetical protein